MVKIKNFKPYSILLSIDFITDWEETIDNAVFGHVIVAISFHFLCSQDNLHFFDSYLLQELKLNLGKLDLKETILIFESNQVANNQLS